MKNSSPNSMPQNPPQRAPPPAPAGPVADRGPACLSRLVAETIEEVRGGRRSAQTTPDLQLDVLGGLDIIAAQLDQVVAVLRPEREPRTDEGFAGEERLAASR